MKRLPLVLAAFLVAAVVAVAPGAASAKIVELGQTTTPLSAPECPKGVSASQCFIVLAQTTAVQMTSDGVLNPTRVTRAGWIVAFTLGLSRLSSDPKTERTFLHTLDTARAYCGRIIGMASGRIVFDGAPEQLTHAVLRDIYGDHEGSTLDERITSTSLPSEAMPAMART